MSNQRNGEGEADARSMKGEGKIQSHAQLLGYLLSIVLGECLKKSYTIDKKYCIKKGIMALHLCRDENS
jgi:hypothetical protein